MKIKGTAFLSLAVVGCLASTATLATVAPAAAQDGKRICVSWRHFQEERWRIDEAGIKSVLDPAGAVYVSADAQADPQKQLTDVESLLASGCNALILLAQDSKAVLPAVERAKAEGVPVIVSNKG